MKTCLAAAALALFSFLFALSPATAQAAGCDCQKELRAFMNAQDKVADLQREIAKMDGKIADAENDVDRQKQDADKLQRQLQGTLDLMNRAAKKGVNVDNANLANAVKDAKKEVDEAVKELQRRIDKMNDLKKQKDALEAKLKQAQADEAAAGKAYTACRHRCAAAAPVKPKVDPGTDKHVEYFFDRRLGNLKDLKSQCTACDAAYDKLLKAEANYAGAQKAVNSAYYDLHMATNQLLVDEVQRKLAVADLIDASDALGDIYDELLSQGVKDNESLVSRPEVQKAQKAFQEAQDDLKQALTIIEHDKDILNAKKAAFAKAGDAAAAAEKAMNDAAAGLEQCNASCYKHAGSSGGLIPGLSFGFGMGMGGGDHRRGGDDIPRRRD